MDRSNYVMVLGASGNIGGKIVEELLQKDVQIGVVGRSYERLQKFEGKADIFVGDISDDEFIKSVLQKATSLFLTVPDNMLLNPETTAAKIKSYIEHSPITHIVNISNCIVKRAGKFTRLVALEQELNKIQEVNIKHLRCANFFDNLNWGINTPYRADLKLPYISSYEVAHVAASYLYLRNFSQKSVDALFGEKDYSMKEFATILGLAYEQQPYTPQTIDFYKPFNDGDFELDTGNRISGLSHKKFTLEYFLENDLRL